MENPEVAQVLDEVADLLEIQDANPFRVRAYRNAARTIRDLSESLSAMDGIPIVIDTDAHSVEELGFLEFGVYPARRAGLEARHVANARSLAEFRKLIRR